MKLRKPDAIGVFTETERFWTKNADNITFNDICIELVPNHDTMKVMVSADSSPLRYVRLRFNRGEAEKRNETVRVFGDSFDRGHGNLHWSGIEPDRMMPWYLLVSNGSDREADVSDRFTECFGVKTQPNAFIMWQYDPNGVTLWIDVRNGGSGVLLGGRKICACEILFEEYRKMSAFEAGKRFCAAMCDAPKKPKRIVYGSNNWYYTYGVSSDEEILTDSRLVARLTEGLANRPYMVIDDGWSKNQTDAPWTETNERFHDMKALCEEMKKTGVTPGIWVRLLANGHGEIRECKPEWRLSRASVLLDPSHPEVLQYVEKTVKMLREWGFELIKHDFSAVDIGGTRSSDTPDTITKDGWAFYDRTKTTAEIVLAFYRTIRKAAGDDCVIIGCSTYSHLAAGIFELQRTGDDISGMSWATTRRKGVNSLAFRMIQNGTFYLCDADCVGIMGKFPWDLNRRWLDLLAKSGTPLFVSCKPEQAETNPAISEDLKAAFSVNSVQKNECIPLDWMENELPEWWQIDGKTVRYDWYDDTAMGSFME